MGIENAIIALTVASAGSQILGGIQANRQARKEAARARAEAEVRAKESERETRKLKARQITGFLKSGVLLEGTPLEVLEETELLGAQDAAAIRTGGAASASRLRAQGRQRLIGGIGGAGRTALSGIQTGAFGSVGGG